MSKYLKAAMLASFLATPALAGQLGLGRPAEPDEVAAWDTDVRPDGTGLPEGKGDVWTGEEVFADQCAMCHGDFGEAVGRWPVLAGGQDSLTDDRPVKTIGSYWPYLSTVWDYINRAMPFGNARSLSNDEVYAITAYLLYLNDLVDDDFELSRDNFAEVRLPNEENFFMDDRAGAELADFAGGACMENCKDGVKITARAAIIDVTPEDSTDDAAPAETATAARAEEPAAGPDPELAASGEKVYKKCKACHQTGDGAKNKVGPQLNNLIGRPAASIDGFKYSKALAAAGEAGLVWDEASLAGFLASPKTYMKGTKMSFAGLKKEADIQAVTEYFKTFSE